MNVQTYKDLLNKLANEQLRTTPDSTTRTTARKQQFVLQNGTLWRNTPNGLRRVLTRPEVEAKLRSLHDGPTGAHFRIGTTTSKVKQRFWWPEMAKDIKHYVESCDICQRRKAPPHHTQVMHPIEVTAPFDRWGIDIVHFPCSDSGNRYAIVAIDYFTKWPEARAIPNYRAETVAQFIFEDIICRHGCPYIIQSDRGTSFDNQLLDQLLTRYDIKHTLVAPYHPQSNGLVERLNQTIGRAIAKMAQNNVKEWDKHLAGVLLAYRSAIQSSAHETPFYLAYGRHARLPVDCDRPLDDPDHAISEDQRITRILDRLEPKRAQAAQHIAKAQERQKEHHDAKVKPRPILIGEKVWLLRSSLQSRHDVKLEPKWDGPFYVHDSFGNGTFKLRKLKGGVLRMPAHADRLEHYVERDEKKLFKDPLLEPVVIIEPHPLHKSSK